MRWKRGSPLMDPLGVRSNIEGGVYIFLKDRRRRKRRSEMGGDTRCLQLQTAMGKIRYPNSKTRMIVGSSCFITYGTFHGIGSHILASTH
ncbi:hypothetical protein L2E82_01879 [Cichorium intybus]|uniref:Uncharacterized protein n=1 Tax=Cichorium intybus TaxID=13427 RepID=A0ACB9H0L6_CICIN|nr:hypothetical protein L2E82_01879 [Cichorium intybus]